MRIIFICGSLDPGKDGVGDYTRRLAAELIKQGNKVSIIALYDKTLKTVSSENQSSEGVAVPVLRLPYNLKSSHRFSYSKNWIDEFNPDWISIQFVIFSFHQKGLPFGITRFFEKLTGGRKLQIMFHELWVGMNPGANLKLFIWGKAQRLLIKTLINELKPDIVHTQAKVYQEAILQLGFKANYLPLFGNIPISKSTVKKRIVVENSGNEILRLLIFGTIHFCSSIDSFLSELKLYAHSKGKHIEIVIVGRSGSETKTWVGLCNKLGIRITVVGEHPEHRISEIISSSSIGISTVSMSVIEKSGTVAAMLEHGLPVISVANQWKYTSLSNANIEGVLEYKVGKLAFTLDNLGKTPNVSTVTKVSKIFIENLN